MDAKELLAKLEALNDELSHLSEDQEAEKKDAIPAQVQMEINDIDAEYKLKLQKAENDRISELGAVISKELIEHWDAIAKAYFNRNMELNNLIAETEKSLREEVIKLGASVKGTTLHAVFSKGTAKWDNKKLEGFALVHPEVMNCREPLVPTVTLRKITKKDE